MKRLLGLLVCLLPACAPAAEDGGSVAVDAECAGSPCGTPCGCSAEGAEPGECPDGTYAYGCNAQGQCVSNFEEAADSPECQEPGLSELPYGAACPFTDRCGPTEVCIDLGWSCDDEMQRYVCEDAPQTCVDLPTLSEREACLSDLFCGDNLAVRTRFDVSEMTGELMLRCEKFAGDCPSPACDLDRCGELCSFGTSVCNARAECVPLASDDDDFDGCDPSLVDGLPFGEPCGAAQTCGAEEICVREGLRCGEEGEPTFVETHSCAAVPGPCGSLDTLAETESCLAEQLCPEGDHSVGGQTRFGTLGDSGVQLVCAQGPFDCGG